MGYAACPVFPLPLIMDKVIPGTLLEPKYPCVGHGIVGIGAAFSPGFMISFVNYDLAHLVPQSITL